MTTTAGSLSTIEPVRGGFRAVLRAEWTKFRTVRGWVGGLVLLVALCVLFTFLDANGQHTGSCTGPSPPSATCTAGHPFVPTGPDGDAVADSYEYVDQSLAGDGTLTAHIAGLTGVTANTPANEAPSLAHTDPGLSAWAKAGILATPSAAQGSPYAAVMTTAGYGARFQYNYTHDRAGPPGTTSRWLRLTRTGAVLTGYASADGTTWTQIGTTHLSGLTTTVHIGLFVTAPQTYDGLATRATATVDHVTINGASPSSRWRGHTIGTSPHDFYTTLGTGSFHRAGETFVLSGSGDIAPAVAQAGGDTAASSILLGLLAGLIVIVVIAAMFITAEYRRGLIRTTFTTMPNRLWVLAAKAVIIGAIALVTGAVTSAVAIPLGEHLLTSNGDYIFPTSAPTIARITVGSGAVLALTAVGVLALGAIVRTSAGTVTAGIVVFVLPYILSQVSTGGWLFRLTPAAGFAVLGALPRSAQVAYPYTFANGYYPLGPWAGLAVLAGYTILGLTVAAILIRRRDA